VDWAEKYRPRSLKQVVGNPTAVKELQAWADSWEHRPAKKAVVLAGGPGVGKTSAALALAADMGWTPIEMNASDARTAERIRETATRGATQQTFTVKGDFVTAREGGRKLIVLDEADNLFGNQDRGGAAQMSETVRQTAHPIVLIVNDYPEFTRRSSAMKTLAKKIEFRGLQEETVASVLRRVCAAEGVEAEEDALRAIAKRAGGDLRSAINDLQSLALGRVRLAAADVNALGSRDSHADVWFVLREIFRSGDAARARKAKEELDESPEDLILWIDENLPGEYRDPDDLRRGLDALSRADLFLGRVRRRQHYRLWAFASDLMTAGVSAARRGPAAAGQLRFPLWLAKMGRSRGLRATKGSLGKKLGPILHQGSREFARETLPALRELMREDAELRVLLTAQAALEDREVAFLLDAEEDSEAVRRVLAEAAKVARTPEVRPRFMEQFTEG